MILTKLSNKPDHDGKANLYAGGMIGIMLGLAAMLCTLATDKLADNIIGVSITLLLGVMLIAVVFPTLKGILSFIIIYLSIAIPLLLTNYYPAFIPLWLLLIVTFILMEIFFWLTPIKKSKTKKKTFGKTILLKLECLLEVFILFNILNVIRLLTKNLTKEVLRAIWNWIIHTGLPTAGYIVGGIVAIGLIIYILYLWIKLNERKFKK